MRPRRTAFINAAVQLIKVQVADAPAFSGFRFPAPFTVESLDQNPIGLIAAHLQAGVSVSMLVPYSCKVDWGLMRPAGRSLAGLD